MLVVICILAAQVSDARPWERRGVGEREGIVLIVVDFLDFLFNLQSKIASKSIRKG